MALKLAKIKQPATCSGGAVFLFIRPAGDAAAPSPPRERRPSLHLIGVSLDRIDDEESSRGRAFGMFNHVDPVLGVVVQ